MNGIAVASADGSIVLSVGGMSISMDRADALALCSRIRAVAGSPWDRGVPENMDLVRFYILKDQTWNSREVFVVARDAQGTWWTSIVDWHGVASIDPMRGRPSVTQLKPYILVKDLEDVEPVFAECRDIYARRLLDEIGLGPLADIDPGVGFQDAVMNEDGVLCVLSRRRPLRGEERRFYTTLTLEAGAIRNQCASEEESTFRDGLKHLTADEARQAVRAYSADFYDSRLDIIRGWVQ